MPDALNALEFNALYQHATFVAVRMPPGWQVRIEAPNVPTFFMTVDEATRVVLELRKLGAFALAEKVEVARLDVIRLATW